MNNMDKPTKSKIILNSLMKVPLSILHGVRIIEKNDEEVNIYFKNMVSDTFIKKLSRLSEFYGYRFFINCNSCKPTEDTYIIQLKIYFD